MFLETLTGITLKLGNAVLYTYSSRESQYILVPLKALKSPELYFKNKNLFNAA